MQRVNLLTKISDRKRMKRIQKEFLVDSTPVIDRCDIRKTAQTFTPNRTFTYLSRLLFHVMWASAKITLINFADNAALTNGIQILYDGNPLFTEAIKENHDFAIYAYDSNIQSDNAAAPSHHLTSRLSFTKFTAGGIGLRLDGNHTFEIVTQDDLSAVGSGIFVTLEGWYVG